MKRETRQWLRRGAADSVTRHEEFGEVLAELKRLRRIERAARGWLKASEDVDYVGENNALDDLREALKKGGKR